jgi:hypothetical protein
MRSPQEWAELDLGSSVCLLLGWRDDDGELAARPVELSAEIGEELLGACRYGLNSLGERTARTYTADGALEGDEFFSLPLPEESEEEGSSDDDITSSGAGFSEEELAASQLVGFVQEGFEMEDNLTKTELASGGWLFYVVVALLKEEKEPIGFVRQYNPQRGIKAGRLLAAYQNTLKRFDQPLFNFDFEFDVVVAPDEIAVMKVTGFERVFSDLAVAVASVPTHAVAIKDELGMSFAKESTGILEEICEERPRYAKRLQRLAGAAHLKAVTPSALRTKLEKHGIDKALLGAGDDLVLGDRGKVAVFLDMLEQRYYEADFTEEHRRADRFSDLAG